MTNAPINFKEERDFGDLFNATFTFLSQELKKLATVILYYVVPFLLLAAIVSVIYSVRIQEISKEVAPGANPNPFAVFSMIGSMTGYIILLITSSIVASNMLLLSVYGYINLYVKNDPNGFTIKDVWGQIAKNFWRFFGASIVLAMVIILGVVFCVVPGIYLGIALSIVGCIMMFEGKSFSDSFGRSMKLINTNWWTAFGVLVIAMILFYILSILISVPSLLMGFKSLFSNLKNGQKLATDLSVGFYIVSAITSLFTQLISVIPIVITAFLYFSYVEKVEKPSLMEKINRINENE